MNRVIGFACALGAGGVLFGAAVEKPKAPLVDIPTAPTPGVEMPVLPDLAPMNGGDVDVGQKKYAAEREEEVMQLDPITVTAKVSADEYDSTGLGMDESERADPMFANSEMMMEVGDDVLPGVELEEQLALASGSSAADLAAGVERLNLRGFPTPQRRNGFTQVGFPGGLPSASSEVIRGILVPVVGRAAPGGIRNSYSGRSRGRDYSSLAMDWSTHNRYSINGITAGTLIPKQLWHYVNVRAMTYEGPQPYAKQDVLQFTGSLAWRYSPRTSFLFTVDAVNTNGNPSAGVPSYRATASGPIIGPYKPLVNFNSNGPNAHVWTRYLSASGQMESRWGKQWEFKAMVQAVQREVEQDRFTAGQYALDTKKFTGTREPYRIEQEFKGAIGEADLTWRTRAPIGEHKISLGLEAAMLEWERVQRNLSEADRNNQPLSVRVFDPYDPNWERPEFSTDKYNRFVTNRLDESLYTVASLSTRSAFFRGLTVVTFGLRYEMSEVDVWDYRDSNAQPNIIPHSSAKNSGFYYHAGINQLLFKRRVMLFANMSTAVDLAPVVDSRTGKIHGSENTEGVEGGFKTVLANRTLSFIALGFHYKNENITRTNPAYNDSILDPNSEQPQLLSSGAERFSGFQCQLGWKMTPSWTFSVKYSYVNAITVSSPSLPNEEGNEVPRLPPNTVGAGLRYAVQDGKLKGLSFNLTLTYFDDVVANYQTSVTKSGVTTVTREYYEQPSYFLVGFHTGFGWMNGKTRNIISLSLRNALNEDLEDKIARPNAGRELVVSWRMML